MKRMLLTTAAVFAVMCILNISAANAAEYRSKAAGPADWADFNSWQINDSGWRAAVSGEVPDADDFVTIQAGHTIDVATEDANQAADYMDVDGTLNIEAGRTLTLDNTSSSGTTVDGVIYLKASASTLEFSSADHTVSGSGTIDLQYYDDPNTPSTSANINISGAGVDLTSSVHITGHGIIYGAGNYINHGLLHADDTGGTLRLAVTGTVDDGNVTVGSDDDRWQASAASAVLWISSDIGTLNSLVGDFVLSNGTVKIDKAFTTVGRLQISGGTLDVNEDTTMGQDYIEGVQPARSLSASGGTIDVENDNRYEHK